MGDIAAGVELVLKGLSEKFGVDTTDRNLVDTPARVERMFDELLEGTRDTQQQVEDILASSFPCEYDYLVVMRGIEAFSLCPHHLLPVHYTVHVAYLPLGSVVGISKLARLVNVLSRRLVLQEQLADDISSSLMRIEGCRGAACIIEGTHYCMVMRGVKQSRARTITSSLKGVFLEDLGLKQEAFALIRQEG